MKRKAEGLFQKQMEQAHLLDGVDPEIAKLMVQSGDATNKILVTKVSLPAIDLKPSQSTMVLDKALGIAINMLAKKSVGGDLGAIISKDNHILDGHHRWAATLIAGGATGVVGGYQADLDGETLVKVLNVLSKGVFGIAKGKAGKGSISTFTSDNVRAQLKKGLEEGMKGDYPPLPADKIERILVSSFGTTAKGINALAENIKSMKQELPEWAPDRKQMPVIDPKNVPKAVEILSVGGVNWKPPFKQARGPLIRLASAMPKGSEERKVLARLLAYR